MLGLASLTLMKHQEKLDASPCLDNSPVQKGTVSLCGSSVRPCGSCVIPAVPAPPDPSACCPWVASERGEGQNTNTCTDTRLLLQLHLFIPTPVFRAGHGSGRALSPYLLTQGANEPLQILLLVQHHLLLLVLLLQLHLQLPELCGRNPAMLRVQPPPQVPAGQGHCHSGHLAFPKVSGGSTGDQEWATSPGAPPTHGSASAEERRHSSDLQDIGDRMDCLKHGQSCPKAAPAALEFVFAPTDFMALRKRYFLQIMPKHEALELVPLE